jgi:simple sugar transport system ATP-binding protein
MRYKAREEPLMVARNIWKIYDGGYIALSGIDLEIYRGEIHLLLGENGAGKTTLLKILSGAEKPTRGNIIVKGETKFFRSPRDALKLGISMAYQGFSLIDGLSVEENISIIARASGIDKERVVEVVKMVMKDLGYALDPRSKVLSLSPSVRQALEVSIALNVGKLAVLLDEPTSIMGYKPSQKLLEILKSDEYRDRAIVLTSHKIRDILEIGDRYTILKRGSKVATISRCDLDGRDAMEIIGKYMNLLGLSSFTASPVGFEELGEDLLRAERITIADDRGVEILRNASFRLRRKEILAIVSIDGRGVRQLCEAIYGLRMLRSGKIYVKPGTRIRYIPSEAVNASIPEMSVAINASLRSVISKRSVLLDLVEISSQARKIVEFSKASVPSIWKPLKSLSGGNMRRIIAWREALDNPDILIVEEPTANLDLASSESIIKLIRDIASKGAGVLVITSELEDPSRIGCKWLAMVDGELTDPRDFKT